MVRILTAFTALLLLTSTAFAASPEKQAEGYFNALKANNWNAAASFFHPAELDKLRDMLMPLLEIEANKDTPMLTGMLFGDTPPDLATLKKMNGPTFFAKFMGGLFAQMQDAKPEFNSVQVLGTIKETKQLSHILSRVNVSAGGISMTDMEVLTYRSDSTGKGFALSGEITGMAEQLRNMFSAMLEAEQGE